MFVYACVCVCVCVCVLNLASSPLIELVAHALLWPDSGDAWDAYRPGLMVSIIDTMGNSHFAAICRMLDIAERDA